MTTVNDILHYIESIAPPELKLDFDNVGLLAGRGEAAVTRVLVALDITAEVIDEAAATGAQLIVSHHPLIFKSIKSATDADPVGAKLVSLLSRGISAICMHTNLDAAQGGVNDTLAAALGAEVIGILNREEGVSRVVALPAPVEFSEFLSDVKTALRAEGLRWCGPAKPVRLLGICGGAGSDDLQLAAERGCDTYLTADVPHHRFLLAEELDINLIDAGHFPTENVIVPVLADGIRRAFPEVSADVSRRCRQPERYYK